MITVNFLQNFDLFQHLDGIEFIHERRRVIDDLLNNREIPLPEGAVLLPDDRVAAANPSLWSRLSVPFVVGYKYYIKTPEPCCDTLGYFLAAVKVGDEEKLLFSKKIRYGSELCCLPKKQLQFPERSDHINYGGKEVFS